MNKNAFLLDDSVKYNFQNNRAATGKARHKCSNTFLSLYTRSYRLMESNAPIQRFSSLADASTESLCNVHAPSVRSAIAGGRLDSANTFIDSSPDCRLTNYDRRPSVSRLCYDALEKCIIHKQPWSKDALKGKNCSFVTSH